MTQRIGSGPTRRCDQRCYAATHGKCDCICGGRNHGAGEKKAMQNVREHFAPLVTCEHGKIFGYCPEGCERPKQSLEATRKLLREMRREELRNGDTAA